MLWRWHLDDPYGLRERPVGAGPIIWMAWHNRIMALPSAYRRWFRHRRLTVLTSASRDGEVLSRAVGAFGLESVRGSSSRRGARAMREMVAVLRDGRDMVITPDGPRGPREVVQPGVVRLASMTGAPVVPVDVLATRYKALRSWDAFRVPLPGARVTLRMLEPVTVPSELGPGEEDAWCKRLTGILGVTDVDPTDGLGNDEG